MALANRTLFVLAGSAVFLLLWLGFIVLLGFWAYEDAKTRSDKPLIWMLIVLLVPNFLGLLIYLLMGRTKAKTGPNRFKKPLIALAASVLLAVALIAGGAAWLFTRDAAELHSVPGLSVGMIESSWGKQWNLSFKVSGAEFNKTVDLSQAELERFHVSASCDSGRLYLRLSQGAVEQDFELSGAFDERLDLSAFQPGKLHLLVYNDEAKNASLRMSWRESP
ncbi:MAG: hypothetical protein LBD02_07275 [Christensenellaceae bacterium]|jgi:hypothetical protein|nr:hypothetical protein [Christensenellaceae bacterium]